MPFSFAKKQIFRRRGIFMASFCVNRGKIHYSLAILFFKFYFFQLSFLNVIIFNTLFFLTIHVDFIRVYSLLNLAEYQRHMKALILITGFAEAKDLCPPLASVRIWSFPRWRGLSRQQDLAMWVSGWGFPVRSALSTQFRWVQTGCGISGESGSGKGKGFDENLNPLSFPKWIPDCARLHFYILCILLVDRLHGTNYAVLHSRILSQSVN